jgi:hypothetical protein
MSHYDFREIWKSPLFFKVVVKPNHAALSLQRPQVSSSSSPPFFSMEDHSPITGTDIRT